MTWKKRSQAGLKWKPILVPASLLVVLGAALILWGLPFARSWLRGPALPVYWQIPAFSLVERGGQRVTLADLMGKVWVATFIYTHCPDTCPIQTAEMAGLQKEFAQAKDFRLVSITADPENDTPEVLAKYASQFNADPKRWLFLTGEKRAIYRLAQKGFHLSVVDPREGVPRFGPKTLLDLFSPASAHAHHPGPAQPYIHSSRLVLMDRRARVRGTYGGNLAPSAATGGKKVPMYDDETIRRLRRDAWALLREKSR